MRNLDRKNIIIEAKKRMIADNIDSNSMLSGSGLYEVKQDEYIEMVCKEKGFDLATFYESDGKILNNLLRNL